MSTFCPSLKGCHKEMEDFQRSVEGGIRMVRERCPSRGHARVKNMDGVSIMMDIDKWIKIKCLDIRLVCF